MLLVSSMKHYTEENQFELKEIYVSDESCTYILRKTEGFIPIKYDFPFSKLYSSAKNLPFSNLSFGPVRRYEDTDAKSLASYIKEKIDGVNIKAPNAEKTLYEVLSTFGESNE